MRVSILSKVVALVLIAGASVAGVGSEGLFGDMVSQSVKVPPCISCCDQTPNMVDVVARVSPAVVTIASTKKIEKKREAEPGEHPNILDFFDFLDPGFAQRNQRSAPAPSTGVGSGFIIDNKGLVVTNYHVIAGFDHIEVLLGDGDSHKKYKAKLISKDIRTDIALLKIDPEGVTLPYLEFGDSDQAKVGSWVLAIGNPYGLGGTVTKGIISAKSRSLTELGLGHSEFIQTDAPINRGNSGGPMIDMSGRVIGVNSVMLSPTRSGGSVGIGFAIPSNLVQNVIKQLRQNGSVQRSWLGVKVQSMDDEAVAKSMGMGKTVGALVAEVTPKSPAEKAGIKAGDIIVKFNEVPLVSSRKLPIVVSETPVNSKVIVEVFRRGSYHKLTATLASMPDDIDESDEGREEKANEDAAGNKDNVSAFGMVFRDLTQELRTKQNVPKDVVGVMVYKVDRSKIAVSMGPMIKPGDVIMQINQTPITTTKDVAKISDKLKERGDDMALMLVLSEGHSFFVMVNFAQVSN